MPSVVEWVRACGLPPPAGISYALNTPDWLLVTRIARSSGENDAPTIEVVFMNCSIVYRGTGARCAAAALGMALASASSSRITRPDEGGQRTGRSSGGGCQCSSRDRGPPKSGRPIHYATASPPALVLT